MSLSLNLEGEPVAKPDLYLVAVGINRYEDPQFDLDLARPDAAAIARYFQAHGSLFRSVRIRTLFDQDATKENISRVLGETASATRADDVLLVYLAGHGAGVGDQFYFFAHEMRTEMDEEAAIRSYGIPASLLGDVLFHSRSLKEALILDTCDSGAALPVLAKSVMYRSRGMGPVDALDAAVDALNERLGLARPLRVQLPFAFKLFSQCGRKPNLPLGCPNKRRTSLTRSL